jgi:acetyl esterase/lipase
MALSTKFVRMQLEMLKPFLSGCSLKTVRAGQAKVGALMAGTHKKQVNYIPHPFQNFIGEWITPKAQICDGVILYLHGGGYVSGDIEYAKGFGTILAAKNGIKVFCAAYRLAPENRYPAALEDALIAYQYLLDSGYNNENIVLCGESAGGGLIFSLCMKLKEQGKALPIGIVAISPWTDLTASGKSYEINQNIDPLMTKERLNFFASSYADDLTDPFISPLFGELQGMPPSIIFVGGDEIMLDDATQMYSKLQESGCKSELIIAPKMWHGYVLYGLKESKKGIEKITEFISEALHERT